MFIRLCGMHLDTESDGEQDFLPVFNYSPGKTTYHLCRPRHTLFFGTPNQLFSLDLFLSLVYCVKGDSSEEDSDECSCANGRCVRSYLGTMCECNTGFRLDHSRTRCIGLYSLRWCYKVLLFAETSDVRRFIPLFRGLNPFDKCACLCLPDIDECAEPGARVSLCKNARCANTAGSYKCLCKPGFVATRRPNSCVRRRAR